jgi:hypothetical protein
MPAEHRQVLLGCREVLGGHREHVVGDLVADFLIDVVTDAGPVRQQVLDRHVLADERQIPAQHRARCRRQAQHTIDDQADHGERGQPLGPAGDSEPGVEGVRYLVRAVSQAVRLTELDLTATVHRHHTGESALIGERVDRFGPGPHPRTVQPRRARDEARLRLGPESQHAIRGYPAGASSGVDVPEQVINEEGRPQDGLDDGP